MEPVRETAAPSFVSVQVTSCPCDPGTPAAYSGNLTDNGGTIQITSAGAYDISASVTDPTGRVFAAPAVTVAVSSVVEGPGDTSSERNGLAVHGQGPRNFAVPYIFGGHFHLYRRAGDSPHRPACHCQPDGNRPGRDLGNHFRSGRDHPRHITFTVSSGWANSGSLKDRPMVSHTAMAALALNVRPRWSVTLAVTV